MLLILLVVIFVPLQSARLAELYKSTTPYQRAKYAASNQRAHVILTGAITPSSIINFCREYFANDPWGALVILSNDTPTPETKKLLRHPYYKNRVHYLTGTALNASDLARCAAASATGFFLLHDATESSSDNSPCLRLTHGADAEILMVITNIKQPFIQ